jgi:hypothetical protein
MNTAPVVGALLLLTAAAHAHDAVDARRIEFVGSGTCETFNIVSKRSDLLHVKAGMKAWFDGYLTASRDLLRGIDPQGRDIFDGVSEEELVNALDRACSERGPKSKMQLHQLAPIWSLSSCAPSTRQS